MNSFDFQADHILENDTVMLRPLTEDDFDLLLEYSVNEPEIWSYNAFGARGRENLEKYMKRAVTNRQTGIEYPFIVFDKRKNKYAGSTRFYDFQFERNTVQLGNTWYGKDYQGTGLNKNCKYLLLDFAFSRLGVDRVGFGANAKNERSIMAMKSIGCTVEGILRSNSIGAKGERIDVIVLSILKPEWQSGLKERLASKIYSNA